MRRKLVLLAVSLAFTSCMSFPYVYSQPGHDYRLSWGELAEISRLASHRSDIHMPIATVQMLGPDYAEATSGHMETEGAPMTCFSIRKKLGKWSISDVRQATVASTD
jgi:hypothetical protein